MAPRPSPAGADDVFDATNFDVMSADPMGDDDGEDWNANELGRGQGEEESEPLDTDDDQEAGSDDQEEAVGDPDENEEELEADGEEEEEGEESDSDLEPIEPPANWPEDVRETFAALPPHLQHWYVDSARHMQADYTRKTQAIAQERQQIAQRAQTFGELERTIAPYQQQWALNGMNPAQAVTQLIALSNFATSDPTGFIQYFANLRGVDLGQLVQTRENEYVDPQVQALRQPLAEVQARLNQLQQHFLQGQQQQQQQQYQSAYRATEAAIDNFSRQTGQDGKPLYPHFDEVIGEMTALIESGAAKTMHDAYRKAVWVNENTRARELARSAAQQNAKARQRAVQAKRAASSLTGASSSNGAFTPDNLSIRDTINAAYDGSI